jgi:hypothetical protein
MSHGIDMQSFMASKLAGINGTCNVVHTSEWRPFSKALALHCARQDL